jgi:hypothetical protein
MDPKQMLQSMYIQLNTEFEPQHHVIHKPNMKGSGQALKIQLRLAPKWVATNDQGDGYFDAAANKQGGLFLEIAPQGPKVNDNPTFLWKDESQLIRCKLGIPDISGLLAAMREYRVGRADVPAYLQDRKNPQPNQVSLFHKNKTGSTIIQYTLEEQQSILRISKGKDQARSIALTPGEEIIFQALLEQALRVYLKVGKR